MPTLTDHRTPRAINHNRRVTREVLNALNNVQASIGQITLAAANEAESESETFYLDTHETLDAFDSMWLEELVELDKRYGSDMISMILDEHDLGRPQ